VEIPCLRINETDPVYCHAEAKHAKKVSNGRASKEEDESIDKILLIHPL
jgi:hypothetical protein